MKTSRLCYAMNRPLPCQNSLNAIKYPLGSLPNLPARSLQEALSAYAKGDFYSAVKPYCYRKIYFRTNSTLSTYSRTGTFFALPQHTLITV